MRSRAIRMGMLAATILGCFAACGGDDGEEPQGPPDLGDCPKLEACGGDPVGEWTVGDICVANPAAFVESLVNDKACASALKSTRDVTGTGTYSVKADKTASSAITVSAVGEFEFTDACVKALGVAQSAASECATVQAELEKQEVVESASCTAMGATCNCTVMSEQEFTGMGSYTVAGTNLNINNLTQPFCVAGSTMKLQTTSNEVTVQLSLTK
jgi:hypothetical protein